MLFLLFFLSACYYYYGVDVLLLLLLLVRLIINIYCFCRRFVLLNLLRPIICRIIRLLSSPYTSSVPPHRHSCLPSAYYYCYYYFVIDVLVFLLPVVVIAAVILLLIHCWSSLMLFLFSFLCPLLLHYIGGYALLLITNCSLSVSPLPQTSSTTRHLCLLLLMYYCYYFRSSNSQLLTRYDHYCDGRCNC